MHRDDGSGPSCQQGLDGFGCKVLAVRINIGEDRLRAAHDHATRRGNKGPTRDDHFVAWADAQCMKPELKCHCPVRYSHAVSATRLYCKFLFKSPALLACPIVHLSGTKDADYRFDFL